MREKTRYAESLVGTQEEEVFFLPNQQILEYEEVKKQLEAEWQEENRKHFKLKSECAYKETAIQGMFSKKIK